MLDTSDSKEQMNPAEVVEAFFEALDTAGPEAAAD